MGALESARRALSNEPMLFYLINIHRAITPPHLNIFRWIPNQKMRKAFLYLMT